MKMQTIPGKETQGYSKCETDFKPQYQKKRKYDQLKYYQSKVILEITHD
jgi:hypothetical protein